MLAGRAQFAGVSVCGLQSYNDTILIGKVNGPDGWQVIIGLKDDALGRIKVQLIMC